MSPIFKTRSIVNAASAVAALLSVSLMGCAGGGEVKSAKKDQAPDLGTNVKIVATSAMPALGYVSARNSATPSAERCPGNDRWQKEQVRNLVGYAEACARLGKSERLESIANFLAQNHHQTPWGPFYLAVAAEQRKDYPRALWMIDLAIKKSPHEAVLHYQKGRIHWALAEYKDAVEAYKISVKENPKFVDAHLFLAQLYFRDQDFKEAGAHFNSVLQAEPDNSLAAAGLAETYVLTGHPVSAIQFYDKAVNLSPRNVSYRVKLAGLYENSQKDYVQALLVYKRLKLLTTEQRTPAEEFSFDLNEKIRRLEEVVNKAQNQARKESHKGDS